MLQEAWLDPRISFAAAWMAPCQVLTARCCMKPSGSASLMPGRILSNSRQRNARSRAVPPFGRVVSGGNEVRGASEYRRRGDLDGGPAESATAGRPWTGLPSSRASPSRKSTSRDAFWSETARVACNIEHCHSLEPPSDRRRTTSLATVVLPRPTSSATKKRRLPTPAKTGECGETVAS